MAFSYLQNLLSSGLPVLHYDNAAALALRHVDCGLALLMDRSPRLLQPRAGSHSANSTTAAVPSQAPPPPSSWLAGNT